MRPVREALTARLLIGAQRLRVILLRPVLALLSACAAGGNLMGVTVAQTDTVTKLLQLMRDVVPALRDACVIWSAVNPGTEFTLRDMKAAAQGIKLSLLPVAMSSATDVDPALASIARARPGALIVLPAAVPAANAERIGELAIQLRIPSIAANKALMERGLLMSYGADPRDVARRIPGYVDRIVKGAKPADMPVERPTKLELAINMKTAKAIGLVIPQALLLRADELTSDALHVRRLAAQLRPLVVVAEPNDLAARSQPATRR